MPAQRSSSGSVTADVTSVRDTHANFQSSNVQHPHFDVVAYQQLKQRVTNLKQEQHKLIKSQKQVEETESVALVEQRQKFEAIIAQLTEKQASLQASLDRASKLRVAHEREKRNLQKQIDQLQRSLEGIEAKHASQFEELTRKHGSEVLILEKNLEETKAAARQQAEEAAAAHAAQMDDIDGWCTGEIEAVRVQAGKHIQDMQQELNKWQFDFEEQRQRRSKAEEVAREAELQLCMCQEDVVKLTSQLADSQMRGEELQQQASRQHDQHKDEIRRLEQDMKLELDKQVHALKSKHAQQLEMINTRLQDVIGRKDSAIASLKTELSEVYAKLQQFEGL